MKFNANSPNSMNEPILNPVPYPLKSNSTFSVVDVDTAALSVAAVDVSTQAGAGAALTSISAAIETVAGQRAGYGALQNRLEYTVSNLMNVSEFTQAARSRIEDADFAAETYEFDD